MTSQLIYTISLILSFTLLCCLLGEAESAITDKNETEALRAIVQLGMTNWNLTEDPCTDNGGKPNNSTFPGLGCNCSYLNNNVCHVTNITLSSLNLSGVLPPELANFTKLQQLDLADNLLTGPLPSQLGSLTSLKYLYLSRNLLSGSIPKELGNLGNLEILDLTDNLLTGPLPSQLGSLTSLKYLHLSSNNFIGQIPSDIGKLKNLTKLILQGTSLNGPIPPNVSNLSQLEDLRISDIAEGGNPLDSIMKLTNLKILVLRNNNITGKIPKDITGKALQKLEILDLSFNKLSGEIPEKLYSLQPLVLLFLGSNFLSGSLSSQDNDIQIIDLSYNQFSGDIPIALSTSISKVNIVRNNLNLKNNGDPTLCLQRNFPCGNKSQNYGFAINCGGNKLKSFGTEFDADLGTTQFFQSLNKKWLVTNTGFFGDPLSQQNFNAQSNATFSISPQNNTIASSQALDPELYSTARISPASLRYYGLDLHNGLYTVELHFAEIQYPDTPDSKRARIFDVYIQGDRKLKDFNIKEAAGDKNVAVVMNYTINVTENFLEIHFFWAGKGACCELQDMHGPLVSAIRVSPQFNVPNSKNHKTVIIIVVVVIILGLLLILSMVLIKERKRGANKLSCFSEDKELQTMENNSFSFKMMKIATNNFNPKNKIGEGGFGAVYKGIMPDGRKVAIKQLSAYSKQGSREFLNEVGLISAAQHPDLVKLYGCCVEGDELLLVYEYMENGNLAEALFDRNESQIKLDWPTRYKICLGIARGLAYLHDESLLKIIHRDIKSTNILLDKDLNPKVADFGLARMFDEEGTHVSTRVAGTIGYMAPEYALSGHLTDKADLYSFGVLILEIVSGRKHTDTSLEEKRAYLLEWVWHLYEEKKVLQLVDGSLLSSGYNEEEVVRIINVGLLCTRENPGRRPRMSTIVEMLEGKIETPASHSRPGYLTHWQVWQLTAGVPHNQAESSTSNTSTHMKPSIESSSSSKQTLSLG
ncbi:probable LRR receptor-like serine/threonine-protein kinase At1g56140 isoform X1 [Cryptomeria japonica]|uniref:probable LRR receptor-like serine/threonine-protein kinase At1g56140 isoform X1 n=2 Tax=Cryptomeria japonica TaxID=3369 RepID=UPI0027DA24FD|nr:probable LRR receptor-like serine/threonine-protein kinase At1g56140 isoform X1 [Cryptomeria japonica]